MGHKAAVLLGPPYAGKTTLGKKAGNCFVHIHYAASGDFVRAAIAEGGELGADIQGYITQGKLVPDRYILPMMEEYLTRSIEAGAFDPGEQFLLLDGIPRNWSQAESLDGVLDMFEVFDCGTIAEEELLARFNHRVNEAAARGRSQRVDDAPEIAKKRIREYVEVTAPVIDFYRGRGIPVRGVRMDVDKRGAYRMFEHWLNNETLPRFHNNL